MIKLISPEHSFEDFCDRMHGNDPATVMKTASAEISYARRLHRENIKERDFRKGSKGREYCENLQNLLSMFMNGSIPSGSTSEFLIAVEPLVQNLLQKWKVGNLRQEFSDLNLPTHSGNAEKNPDMAADPLHIVISKEQVDSGDTSQVLEALKRLVSDVETMRSYRQKVIVSFQGYEDTPEEVFEIKEVRDFMVKLDQNFPFWFYFMDLRFSSLYAIVQCFLPPFLTEEARARIHAEQLADWVDKQWGPALSHICQSAGLTEGDVDLIFSQVMEYLASGPQQHWNN